MVEPLSIAAASASLGIRVFKVIKAINTFRHKYKYALLVLASITAECSTIAAVLSTMQQLALKYSDALKVRFERESQLAEVFGNTLESLA